jgi:hypothetical protein
VSYPSAPPLPDPLRLPSTEGWAVFGDATASPAHSDVPMPNLWISSDASVAARQPPPAVVPNSAARPVVPRQAVAPARPAMASPAAPPPPRPLAAQPPRRVQPFQPLQPVRPAVVRRSGGGFRLGRIAISIAIAIVVIILRTKAGH